jgi:hypothetical protein
MKQTITIINPGKTVGQTKSVDAPKTKGGPEFDCPWVVDFPVHSVPTSRS